MVWKSNEDWSGRELAKVWHLLVPYTRGRVLDVGAGANRIFSHWVTLDASVDYGGQRVTDIQARADRLRGGTSPLAGQNERVGDHATSRAEASQWHRA